MEPFLLNLLGLEESPATEREEMFSAWRTFFERVADLGPTVMVFEDLQWADPGQIDFIEHLLEWDRDRPIFIVTLARAELLEKRPTWGAGQRNFTSIHLEPLSEEDMWALLSGLVPRLPDDLVSVILERAAGVPLYAVETIRMLVDQGDLVPDEVGYRLAGEIEHLDVPDTLHALIAARLDAVPSGDRSLLQDASVLGKTFTVEALSALSGEPPDRLEQRLRGLVRKELLVLDADPMSPERGQFGFVQSLIREVAYQTLARRERQTRHLAAARYFEALGDEELAAVVATHYVEAFHATGESEEGQQLATKARDALLMAADRATSLGSHDQALRYYERALEVASEPSIRMEILHRAADAATKSASFERARELLEQALELYKAAGNRMGTARATGELGALYLAAYQTEVALPMLDAALAELKDVAADPFVVRMMGTLARAHMQLAHWQEAVSWSDRALAAAAPSDLTAVIVEALVTKGVAVHEMGRWREGMVLLSGAVALAEREHLTSEQVRGQNNMSYALAAIDPRAAFQAAREGLELARRVGLRPAQLALLGSACDVGILVGAWSWLSEALDPAFDQSIPESWRLYLMGYHGLLMMLAGDREGAREAIGSVSVSGETDPQVQGVLHWCVGWIQLLGGEPETAFRTALDGARIEPDSIFGVRNFSLAGHAAVWMRDLEGARQALDGLEAGRTVGTWVENTRQALGAAVMALKGRHQDADDRYGDVIRTWRELDLPLDLGLTLGEHVWVGGMNSDDSRKELEEARRIFQGLGGDAVLEALPWLAEVSEHPRPPRTSL